MQILGLISDQATAVLDQMLAEVRRQTKMTTEEFDQFLDKKGQELFALLEGHLAEELVAKYTSEKFHHRHEFGLATQEKIIKHHEDLFHYFFAYIHTACMVYANFLAKIDKSNELESKAATHLLFYGNLCRIADQIGLMLSNGYPDGALRLWRIFYEHAVVAIFLLQKNSAEADTRFRKATFRDRKRSVESIGKHHVELKFPPLSQEFVEWVEREYAEVKDQYGKDFFDNEFAWAKPYVQGKANLRAIEDLIGFSRYRPFYIWACTKSHPNFKEISDFRDSEGKIILSWLTRRRIDRRPMVDPAQLTIAVFHQVNDYFLHLYAGHEYDVNLQLFRKLYDRFGDSLSEEKMDK
jgi:hypothetical protein